jgi:RimJ/RimL family protein N-acetyltransferase
MEDISHAFAGAFQSDRLIYRALEDNEEDKKLLYETIYLDPVNIGLANPGLVFYPWTQRESYDNLTSMIGNCLLAVVICIKPQVDDNNVDDLASTRPKPIGYLALSNFKMKLMAHNRFTRMSIQIAAEFQNKGYGTEAITWAIDWAFTWANVHKVELGTASYNDRASGLYERLGFKQEGRRREVVFMNRQWYDLVEFGMLEDEWLELKRKQKEKLPLRRSR